MRPLHHAGLMDVITGPSWAPHPRLLYLASGALSLGAGLLFLIAAVFFHQARFGFGVSGVLLVAVAAPLLWAAFHTHRRFASAKALRANGLHATAEVRAFGQTGVMLRGDPLLELDLVVHVQGRPPVRLRQREYVPRPELARVAAGESVPVRVDPDDPTNLVIEWPGS